MGCPLDLLTDQIHDVLAEKEVEEVTSVGCVKDSWCPAWTVKMSQLYWITQEVVKHSMHQINQRLGFPQPLIYYLF